VEDDCGGERYEDRPLGNGGTGGTLCSGTESWPDPVRSLSLVDSPAECTSALFRLDFPPGNLPEAVETDVTLVLVERDTESLELVVGLV
jgi:hypothetical protein